MMGLPPTANTMTYDYSQVYTVSTADVTVCAPMVIRSHRTTESTGFWPAYVEPARRLNRHERRAQAARLPSWLPKRFPSRSRFALQRYLDRSTVTPEPAMPLARERTREHREPVLRRKRWADRFPMRETNGTP